jgi:transposase-like protein
MVDLLKQFIKQLVCPHQNRVLEMIVREPLTYTRRAQYHCPDCNRSWASAHLPDGI